MMNGGSLPSKVSSKLRQPAIYWAQTPPELSNGSCSPLFWDKFCNETIAGQVCPFLPCFWPHLIVFCLGPCSCCQAAWAAKAAKNRYWIITENELVRYSGGKINAIAFNSPALSGVTFLDGTEPQSCCEKFQGCCLTTQTSRMTLSPTVVVNTKHGQQTVNASDDDFFGCPSEFHRKLLEARDRASGAGASVTGTVVGGAVISGAPTITGTIISTSDRKVHPEGAPITATVVSDSNSSGNTASERLKNLQGLRDQGLLSQSEYDSQRQVILSSV
jgi:hypothetical protein